MEITSVNSLDEPYIPLRQEPADSKVAQVQRVAYLVFTSPLVWTGFTIGSLSLILPAPVTVAGIVLIAAGILLYPHRLPSSLVHELSLLDSLTREFLTRWNIIQQPYYSEIISGIYVGAIPLKSHGHHEKLLRDLKVKAILLVVEEHELATEAFFASPIQKHEWGALELCHISTPDMTPLTSRDLHIAADFIKKHEHGIYIHCRAGRGRSVSALIAYLMKYQNKSYDQAYRLIEQKRPMIVLTQSQKNGFIEFARSLSEPAVDAAYTEVAQ